MSGNVPAPANAAQLRWSNRAQVLGAFLSCGRSSAGEVAERIGLSRQTVMKAIQFFLRTGLLESAGKGNSTCQGGKRPDLFALTRDRYFLCITLWPRYLHLHLCTLGGITAADLVREEPMPGTPGETLGRIGRLCAELVRDSGLRMEQVKAVSISVSGVVDHAAGCLRYSAQSPDLGTDGAQVEQLRHWFPPETLIFPENTGKMAARPLLQEEELARKRVLTVCCGRGLSGCLADQGQILGNSLIGEIGHMIVDPGDREVCGCGSRGCLERLVSIRRIREKAALWASEHPATVLMDREALTVPAVFAASEQGDPLARELVRYLAGCFAVALRNVSLVFDPEVVVFQGDYAHADGLFCRTLMEHMAQFRYFPEKGPFALRFDRRDLAEMDTWGGKLALAERYFAREELYID